MKLKQNVIIYPTLPATLATPQSAVVTTGGDRTLETRKSDRVLQHDLMQQATKSKLKVKQVD